MKWTKECEGGEGFYWFEHLERITVDNIMKVTEVVYVMKVDDDWWIQFTGTDADELLSNFEGYWYGPLEAPEFKL